MDDRDWLGRTVLGYRIDSELGGGASSRVFRAVHVELQRPAALKVLAASYVSDVSDRRRFHREVALHKTLRHPNVVRRTR